jgi:hypothetical protein
LVDVLSAHALPHTWKPFEHEMPQLRPSHVAMPVPDVGGGQAEQLLPHVIGDVLSAHAFPQAWKPLLHENPHMLFAQLGCPLFTIGHWLPHVMQFCAFVEVSTHEPLHSVGKLFGQPDTQPNELPPSPPPLHTGVPPLHVVLQEPQCAGCERSASQPLSLLPSQLAKPGAHALAG